LVLYIEVYVDTSVIDWISDTDWFSEWFRIESYFNVESEDVRNLSGRINLMGETPSGLGCFSITINSQLINIRFRDYLKVLTKFVLHIRFMT
jgi:hypothetical protein